MIPNESNQILLYLQKIVNQIDTIQEKVNQIDAIQEKVNQIDAIQEKVNQIDAIQEKVSQIDAIQEKVNQIDSMQQDIKELKQETRKISQSVAVLEHEHGEKIQALLDGQIGILEKLDLFESTLNSHNNILDNHSDRIWNLESKLGIV